MTRWSPAVADGNVVVAGYGLVICALVDGEWKWHRHVANITPPE